MGLLRVRSPPPGGKKLVITILGTGALSGKMLFVRIVENNKIDNYVRAG